MFCFVLFFLTGNVAGFENARVASGDGTADRHHLHTKAKTQAKSRFKKKKEITKIIIIINKTHVIKHRTYGEHDRIIPSANDQDHSTRFLVDVR